MVNEDIIVNSVEEGKLSEKHGDSSSVRVRVRVRVREIDESSTGIKGTRPPMLKPPPGARVQVVDDSTCSTWDLLRDLAPQGEEGLPLNRSENESEVAREVERGAVEKEEGEVGTRESPKREEEENVAGLSESCSFSTSNEDDSSSSTTDPTSNNISPQGRIKRIITAGSWQKGEFLGGGSFGSVYEGISE